MTMEATEQLECPNCGNLQEVIIWRSVNVTLDPSLRDKLFERRINAFHCEKCEFASYLGAPLLYHDMRHRFCVQFYPPATIDDDEFIDTYAPEVPTYPKAFPGPDAGYVTRPHLVFDMDDMMHCITFFERLLPAAVEQAGEEEP